MWTDWKWMYASYIFAWKADLTTFGRGDTKNSHHKILLEGAILKIPIKRFEILLKQAMLEIKEFPVQPNWTYNKFYINFIIFRYKDIISAKIAYNEMFETEVGISN